MTPADRRRPVTAPARPGRADLHIHTRRLRRHGRRPAILDHVAGRDGLDVIAITDHERIDAALAGPGDRARPRPAVRGRRRRGGHDPRRPPARAGHRAADPRPIARCATRSPPSTTPAAWRSRPTRSSRTRCAPRAGSCDACSTTRTQRSTPTPSRRSTRRRSAAVARRVVRFADGHGLAHVGNSDAHALEADRDRLDHASRAGPRPTCARRSGARDRAPRHVPRHGRAARRLRTAAAQAGPRRPRRARRPRPPRRDRPRPRLSGRRASGRPASTRADGGRP